MILISKNLMINVNTLVVMLFCVVAFIKNLLRCNLNVRIISFGYRSKQTFFKIIAFLEQKAFFFVVSTNLNDVSSIIDEV